MSVLDYVKRTPLSGRTNRPMWRIQRPEYYVQTGSMFENPHGVPHEEVVRMILDNPAEVVAQVVFGKYVESDGLVFTAELVQGLFDRSGVHYGTGPDNAWNLEGRDFRVLANSWLHHSAANAAHQLKNWHGRRSDARMSNFATGVDFARQTDYTVIYTLDVRQRPAKVVYYKRLNRVPWDTIYAEVGKAVHLFGANVLCDSTGPGGDVSMDRLQSSTYCPIHHRINQVGSFCTKGEERLECTAENYVGLSGVDGYAFSGPSKKELIEHLRNCLANGYYPGIEEPFGWLRCPPIPQLEEELSFYAWDDKRLQTDSIFALALAAFAGLEDVPSPPLYGSPMGR